MSTTHTPRGIAVAMLGLGALLSACGGGGPASSPTAPARPPATPPPTATPTSIAQPSPTAVPTLEPGTAQVSIYLIRDGKVTPVHRVVTIATPAHDALVALTEPPTASEHQSGMNNDVPGTTRLNRVTISGGLATVDLSREFALGIPDQGRVAQVVYTLTRFATVQRVTILLDGTPIAHIGAVNTSVPLTRASVEQWVPAILAEAPVVDATVGSPLRIWGTANTFEATFRIRMITADGGQLFDDAVHTTSGTGTRGSFDVTVRFTSRGPATLALYEVSMKDGSPINAASIPLTLAP